MYPNLKAEMSRKNITAKMISEAIDVNPSAVSAKMNNKERMKLYEAKKIRDNFFPGMPLDYLFSTVPVISGENSVNSMARAAGM